jgi:hypothetical protein
MPTIHLSWQWHTHTRSIAYKIIEELAHFKWCWSQWKKSETIESGLTCSCFQGGATTMALRVTPVRPKGHASLFSIHILKQQPWAPRMLFEEENQRLLNDLQEQPHATAVNPRCLLECVHPVVKGTKVQGAAHCSASPVWSHLSKRWWFEHETLTIIISTLMCSW